MTEIGTKSTHGAAAARTLTELAAEDPRAGMVKLGAWLAGLEKVDGAVARQLGFDSPAALARFGQDIEAAALSRLGPQGENSIRVPGAQVEQVKAAALRHGLEPRYDGNRGTIDVGGPQTVVAAFTTEALQVMEAADAKVVKQVVTRGSTPAKTWERFKAVALANNLDVQEGKTEGGGLFGAEKKIGYRLEGTAEDLKKFGEQLTKQPWLA